MIKIVENKFASIENGCTFATANEAKANINF